MITGIFAQFTNPETGWSYDQSTLQAFYYLEDLSIDGVSAEGDGLAMPAAQNGSCYNNLNTCDVIGAFAPDGTCVGWAYSGILNNVMTVPAMITDGLSEFTQLTPNFKKCLPQKITFHNGLIKFAIG